MRKNSVIVLLFGGVLLVLLGSCGGGGSGAGGTTFTSGSGNTYATTSTRGDYAEWSLSGSTLNAIWQVIDGTGQTDYTFGVTANCAAADAFNLRRCTITTASCTPGVSACPAPPSGALELMEAPRVALFVNTDSGMVSDQLHIGLAKNNNACAEDISGDYTFIRTGLGVNENFGMYRTDSNAISIRHSDFGFDTSDANVSNQSVAYRTGTELETFTDVSCVNGVRTRETVGGDRLRLMATSSGLFVLDLPAGQGGLVSFKTGSAASLVDFAGRSFTGISFPDNGAPEALRAVFGSPTGVPSRVGVTVTFPGSATQMLRLMDLGTMDNHLAPPYPDFTTAPAGYIVAAPAQTLAATYATPDDIPGLFKFDSLGDSGRVIIAATISGGKVIGMGMVYNYRDGGDTNPSTGAPFISPGLYNTGNFIIFEE